MSFRQSWCERRSEKLAEFSIRTELMLTSPSLQTPTWLRHYVAQILRGLDTTWLGHYVAVVPNAVLAPVRLSGSMTNTFLLQELPAGRISETSEVATKI